MHWLRATAVLEDRSGLASCVALYMYTGMHCKDSSGLASCAGVRVRVVCCVVSGTCDRTHMLGLHYTYAGVALYMCTSALQKAEVEDPHLGCGWKRGCAA